MKPKHQRLRLVRRILMVLCIILSGFAVYELVRPHHTPRLAREAGLDTGGMSALLRETEGDILPIAAFAEIIERPLFMENRRPYVAPEPVVVREPEPEPVVLVEPDITEQVSLRATIIIGEKRIALVQELAVGKQRRLAQGEAYNGWILTNVETDGISMQKGEEVRQMKLKKN